MIFFALHSWQTSANFDCGEHKNKLKQFCFSRLSLVTCTCFQIVGKITEEGVFLEQLETNPDKYLPEVNEKDLGTDVVQVGLASFSLHSS